MKYVLLLIVAGLLPANMENGAAGSAAWSYKEDFTGYEVGDPVLSWGDGVIKVDGTGKGKGYAFLTSQVPGGVTARQEMNFPDDFTLSFSWLAPASSSALTFFDESGHTFPVVFAYQETTPKKSTGRYAALKDAVKRPKRALVCTMNNGTATVKVKKGLHHFRVEKKGRAFKLFHNGKFLLSASSSADFGPITGFTLTVPPGAMFTGFTGS